MFNKMNKRRSRKSVRDSKKELISNMSCDNIDIHAILEKFDKDILDIIFHESPSQGYKLTKYFLLNLDFHKKMKLFRDAFSKNRFDELINKILFPENCDDIKFLNKHSEIDYIVHIYGTDLLKVLSSLSDEYPDNERLQSIFRKKLCKPNWIDRNSKDHHYMDNLDSWIPDGNNMSYLNIMENINNNYDRIENDIGMEKDDYYGDGNIDYAPDLPYYDDYKEHIRNLNASFSKYKFDEYNPSIFRAFGPLNNGVNNICNSKLGGCRMLSCNCIDGTNWFKNFGGICQECKNKIESYKYALRLPELDGGWSGLYCCFDCLYKQNVDEYYIDNLYEDISSHNISDKF